MYRLNYPDDPGMHNTRVPQRKTQRRKMTSDDFPSFREEIKAKLSTVSYISLFLTISIGMHIWNESRAVQVSRAVEESLRSFRKLQTVDVIFEENNNKLIHIVGHLSTDRELTAEDYGISVSAVKLKQKLQMYQWNEEKSGEKVKKDDSQPLPSYTYYKTWVDHLVNSDEFQVKNVYENPKEIPELESVEQAAVVKIGNFILSEGLINKIDTFKPITGHIRPQTSAIKLHAGYYYHTEDVWKPQIGDFRVDFAVAGMAGELISVIAKQDGMKLNPYVTESGEEILILKYGRKNPEDMIHVELSHNKVVIWLIRVLVAVLLMISVSRLTNMLNSMVYISPFLRDVLNLGAAHFNLCLGWTIFTFILGLLWIQHRLLLGLGFLTISVLPVIGTSVKLYLVDSNENLRNHAA
ncbi:Transmembrane protein 43 [Chamberlinius hualienensis]